MSQSQSLPAARFLAPRHAAVYAAVFGGVGIYMPFWPLWLSGRGLDAAQIGLAFALAAWTRVVASPLIAQIADASGRAKDTMLAAMAIGFVTFLALVPAQGYLPILLLMLLGACTWGAIGPLIESLTLAAASARRLDYGRVRLWGSVAFVAASFIAGWVIAGGSSEAVLFLILGTQATALLAIAYLPVTRSAPNRASLGGLFGLLRDRSYLLFLAANAALQGSHAVYYSFSAIHWKAAGYSAATVGWLWAEGVIAEILLFVFAATTVARLGPRRLLAIAALGGIVRWIVLGSTSDLATLAVVQLLHAATFGAAHLAAMNMLARAAPPGLAHSAQALYTAVVMGLGIGLATFAAGVLFERIGGQAYYAMAGLSLVALLLVPLLTPRAAPGGPPLPPN